MSKYKLIINLQALAYGGDSKIFCLVEFEDNTTGSYLLSKKIRGYSGWLYRQNLATFCMVIIRLPGK